MWNEESALSVSLAYNLAYSLPSRNISERDSVRNEESALLVSRIFCPTVYSQSVSVIFEIARECVERGERSLASARSLAHLRADGRLSAGALVDGDVASVEVLKSRLESVLLSLFLGSFFLRKVSACRSFF